MSNNLPDGPQSVPDSPGEDNNNFTIIPTHLTQEEQIAFLVLFKGEKQADVAKYYNVTQGWVSQVCSKFKHTEQYNNKLIKVWEKDISNTMMLKAGQTAASIDPSKIPEGSKATTVGILIDKTRLIQGESTENIASIVSYRAAEKDLERQDKAERELRRRLGLQSGDPIPTN